MLKVTCSGNGQFKVSWVTQAGQNLHTIIYASNRDYALETWNRHYSLYFDPEILSGPFAPTGTPLHY